MGSSRQLFLPRVKASINLYRRRADDCFLSIPYYAEMPMALMQDKEPAKIAKFPL
jgi:hypothetical protein